MEAAVILAKCPKRKQLYGIRVEKMADGDFWRTWAFPVDEKRAHREGYDATKVQGSLYYTKKYPGCPYCESKSFVQCSGCSKIFCWNGEEKMTCPWCGGKLGSIMTTTEKFRVSGGDI